VIFSRNRGPSGRHAAGRLERMEPDPQATPDEDRLPEHGPFDAARAPAGLELLDLGSLKIPAVSGVEVRVQADDDGQVQQVVLVHGNSALQLGVFAAPRTEGIWDEVRADIRAQLFRDGVAAQEVDGEYGVELRARVRTPDGLTDIRFVGIDGPRWMVRAVYQGPAAVDPDSAPVLRQCLYGLVVERGHEAMPVREPLPLRLPPGAVQRLAEPAPPPTESPRTTVPTGSSEATAPTGSSEATAPTGSSEATAPTASPTGGERPARRPTPSNRASGQRRKPSPRPRRSN